MADRDCKLESLLRRHPQSVSVSHAVVLRLPLSLPSVRTVREGNIGLQTEEASVPTPADSGRSRPEFLKSEGRGGGSLGPQDAGRVEEEAWVVRSSDPEEGV